ncbi:MAG TPA: tripartite tricarboxylate transporter substrate binding protein [Burkholderiales bacterium]
MPIRLPSCLHMLAGVAIAVAAGAAQAQAYPSKPIRWVVPYTPAGAYDSIARITGEKLAALLGQQVVIDNRPGADGVVGLEQVAKAAPDGYTIVIGGLPTHAINPSLFRKLPYNHITDFAPVSMLARAPVVLVVNNQLPVKSLKEFVAYAQARPGKLSYGSSGAGMRLSMQMLISATGIDMVPVPYKGSAPAVSDLIGGQIPAMIDSVPAELGFIRGGRVRPLAVGSAKRTPVLPDVPTFTEAGVPVESTLWYALFTPAGVPKPVIDRLNGAMVKILAMDDVVKKLADTGIDASSSTPEELRDYVKSETAKWAKAVKEAKMEMIN